jgi:hypothetical protein
MQSKAYKGMYLNTADGVSKILRQEGVIAFTRGFEASLWRQGVWNGMWATLLKLLIDFRLQLLFLTLAQLFRHDPSLVWNASICRHEQRQHCSNEILVVNENCVNFRASLILHFGRSGVFGGILATVFNNPFDVVVSRARNITDYKAAPYKCVFD